MRLQLDRWSSPIGDILLVFDDQGALRALDFQNYEARMTTLLRRQYGAVELYDGPAPPSEKHALKAYFNGDLAALDKIQVATGGSDFQREVWKALRAVPAGATTSYGQLATDLGRPNSSRAVGLANGANPVAIVVPCHRVIGANGALTGYGGGLPRKRWLLDHERRFSSPKQNQGLFSPEFDLTASRLAS